MRHAAEVADADRTATAGGYGVGDHLDKRWRIEPDREKAEAAALALDLDIAYGSNGARPKKLGASRRTTSTGGGARHRPALA